MPAATQVKPEGKTAEKAEAKFKEPEAAKPTHDADGWPLTKKGERDSRYRENPATKQPKSSQPGQTKDERMAGIFGGHTWTLVREGFTSDGLKSITGAQLKSYLVLKDENGNEVTCGKGEAAKFAHVSPPKKERAAPTAKAASATEAAFEGDDPEDDEEEEEEDEDEDEESEDEVDLDEDDA